MKSVLITGASTGIGYDACRYLLEKGFFVYGTVRKASDKNRLEEKFPVNFEALFLDLTSDESIDNLVNYLHVKLSDSGLFGLVNNAGIAKGGPLIHLPYDELKYQMDVNLFSVFKLTNKLSGLLGAGLENPLSPGRIINISSVSGLVNTPMIGPYCMSKHALESMSDIYRRELALYGIKLILLEPAAIKTPIWQKSKPEKNPMTGTDFENIYSVFTKRINKIEANALPVEKVSKMIYVALSRAHPKNRYIIAKNPLMIKLIRNIIPSKWLDRLFLKQLKSTLYHRENK